MMICIIGSILNLRLLSNIGANISDGFSVLYEPCTRALNVES